jgi:hypothetical protein
MAHEVHEKAEDHYRGAGNEKVKSEHPQASLPTTIAAWSFS